MGLLSLILYTAVIGIVGIVILLYYKNSKHAKYFQEKGVVYLGSGIQRIYDLLLGSGSLPSLELSLYKQALSTGQAVVGVNDSFISPLFMIMDLDIIRNIYVKDFDHFVNRRMFKTEDNHNLLNKMLLSLESDRWKGLRSKLSPTFTTSKIRRMFNIFERSNKRVVDYLKKNTKEGGDVEICEIYSKYAGDVVASCAFGIESKSFEYPQGIFSEFEQMASRLQFRFKGLDFFKFMLLLAAPKIASYFGLQPFDVEAQVYFSKVIKSVMKQRRESGERQEDFLQLMMDAQKGLLKQEENSKESLEVMAGTDETGSLRKSFDVAGSKLSFDDDDIVANSLQFFIGGFDTTQSLIVFAVYQLALEQEVQEKVFEEVKASYDANGGKLTYEGVLEMNYLDLFINETLRYYSPALRTERACTKDYKIPGTEIVIDKGAIILLPIWPLHRDSRHYENPDKFDPERFLPERKKDRHPYAFAPFGHGPRNCIGMRFALTEVKSVIANMVYNFKVQPCSRTDIPVKFGTSTTLKAAQMWLNVSPRCEE